MTTSPPPEAKAELPTVVHIGFVGAREFFKDVSLDQRKQYEGEVEALLLTQLQTLPSDLKLKPYPQHFLCGISSLAVGADHMFARCAKSLNWLHRLFLPQELDDFLNAQSSAGVGDFSAAEQDQTRSLASQNSVIQHRIVGRSSDRRERFQETNQAILRSADVVVVLLREEHEHKPGGSAEMLERAKAVGKPVLEIRVGLLKDAVAFTKTAWHGKPTEVFRGSDLPASLQGLKLNTTGTLPTVTEYCRPLKDMTSSQSQRLQGYFKRAVAIVIVLHVLATLFATGAVLLHQQEHVSSGGEHSPLHAIAIGVLALELVALGVGLYLHQQLHHSNPARAWAIARVVAEVARSVTSILDRHIPLKHLSQLAYPIQLNSLFQTLNVLYLKDTFPKRHTDWKAQRTKYIEERLLEEKNGQVAFYTDRVREAKTKLSICHWVFNFCSVLAIVCTFVKLIGMGMHVHSVESMSGWLALGAIVLPTIAVGGLSWKAAMDYEARIHTFSETLEFLEKQLPLLSSAQSGAEFDQLLYETEYRLLSENANWFSRRATTGV